MVTDFAPAQIVRWLGGHIDIRVEVDTGLQGSTFARWGVDHWDVGHWGGPDASWNDISAFVEDITIDTGAERWGERFETGTMTIALSNTDGYFTPESGIDPFHLPFRPGRRIRVVAVPDPDDPLDKKPLFTGYIDASQDAYEEGGYLITTGLICLDFMGLWGSYNPPALEDPIGVLFTSDRVHAALDRMDWPLNPGDRDIDDGFHQVQSSHLAQSVLEECAKAADAEGGSFFCSKDGIPTFRNRDWLSTSPRSTNIQGYLGYAEDELDPGANTAFIESITPSWELARVFNDVQFARVGGHMQQVEDLDSQSLYQSIRSQIRTDLENNDEASVLWLAERYLNEVKDSRLRLDEITISGRADPGNDDLNRLMWDSQFGDLLAIRVQTMQGWNYTRLTKITGISHHITANEWTSTFRLDDVFVDSGGSDFVVNITFEGAGTNPLKSGGSEMELFIEMDGGGAPAEHSGGSEMLVQTTFEGQGKITRSSLYPGLLTRAWWPMNSALEYGYGSDFGGYIPYPGYELTLVGPVGSSFGGPIPGTSPPVGTSDGYLTFDGVDDYATRGNDFYFAHDMSIECWVRPHDATGIDQAIVSVRGSFAGGQQFYEVYYRPDEDRFMFGPTTSNDVLLPIGAGLLHNVWHHLVVTIQWTISGRVIKGYINGVEVASSSVTYQPDSAVGRQFAIGRRPILNDRNFDGDISELAIFAKVLTPEDVVNLYESTY